MRIGTPTNRKYIAIIPALILSSMFYVGIIAIWFFSSSFYPKKDFDKSEWNNHVEERYKMSQDIIDSKMLIGKTKSEVTELLGTDYTTYSEDHIAYYLGFVPGYLKIDPDVLDIYFENEKVVRVNQHET